MGLFKLTAAALAAATLVGCGMQPAAKVAAAAETRLSLSKPKQAGASKVPALAPVAGAAPGPAAASRPGASASAAPAPAAPPALTLIDGPAKAIQLAVFRGPKDAALDLMAEPEDGLARFVVQAPPSGVVIDHATITIEGGGAPIEAELDRAELEWPAKVANRVELGLPILLYETLRALGEAPTATELTFRATLFGPDGEAIDGPDGEPLVLTAKAMVI